MSILKSPASTMNLYDFEFTNVKKSSNRFRKSLKLESGVLYKLTTMTFDFTIFIADISKTVGKQNCDTSIVVNDVSLLIKIDDPPRVRGGSLQ